MSELQIEETDEARRKFAGAKAISSQQFFERDNKELQAQNAVKLQQFQVGRQAYRVGYLVGGIRACQVGRRAPGLQFGG